MKNLLVVFAVVITATAACGGKSKSNSETGGSTEPMGVGSGEGEAALDPTMPSWMPASCTAYHKAVTQAITCETIEQAKRDEIKAKYDAAAASWKAEQDASKERVAEVDTFCTSGADSVKADTAGKCVAPATKTGE